MFIECKITIPEKMYNYIRNGTKPVYIIHCTNGKVYYTTDISEHIGKDIVHIWKILEICSDYEIECRYGECKVKVKVVEIR